MIVGDAFESDFQVVFGEGRQLEERLEKVTHASTHVAIVIEFAAQEQPRLVIQRRSGLVNLDRVVRNRELRMLCSVLRPIHIYSRGGQIN